jgi:hypothetical protein
MTKQQIIAKWMAVYAEAFPLYGESVSRLKCSVYLNLLGDLDESELDAAMGEAARRCTAFPTPGHIRGLAEAAQARALEAQADRAIEALDALVERWGPDAHGWKGGEWVRMPALDATTARALAVVGGWRAYATAEGESARHCRREFRAAWLRATLHVEQQSRTRSFPEGKNELEAEIRAVAASRAMDGRADSGQAQMTPPTPTVSVNEMDSRRA